MTIPWIVELLMIVLIVYIAVRYRGPDRIYLLAECLLFAALGFAVLSLT